MRVKWKIVIFFILTFLWVRHIDCLEWIVDDAVYITPESDNEAELETRSPSEENTKPKQSGECVKFKKCYPILFLTDRKEPDYQKTSINSDLVEFILETVDFCGNSANVTGEVRDAMDPGNLFIWCHLRAIANATSMHRPTSIIIETKAEREDGICGQTSKIISSDRQGERVVGGVEIKMGEAPYMVVMTYKGKQVCGGSVIDEYHVLSAAHCVSHLQASQLHQLKFIIGDHNIKDPTDVEHLERNVSKIIYHKEFSSDTLHDDIAMIKLSEPIQYSSTIGPVCLSDGSQPIDDGSTYGRLVGWGQLEEGGERPNTPRAAELRIWKTEDCEDVYEDIVPEDIMEKAFCAGGFQDGGETDACKGDSGGPMTIVKNNKNEQVGIVSFGIGCGRYPGVFTEVSKYTSWIDRHRTRYRL